MLALSPQRNESLAGKKCGEIFCINANIFNVSCCLCGSKMQLGQFSNHFQFQHVCKAEESIQNDKLKNDSILWETISVKEENLAEQLIKQEEQLEWSAKLLNNNQGSTIIDDDNKWLQELIKVIKSIERKLKHGKVVKEDPDCGVLAGKRIARMRKNQGLKKKGKIYDPFSIIKIDKEMLVSPLAEGNLNKLKIHSSDKDDSDSDELVKSNKDANYEPDMQWFSEQNDSEKNSDSNKVSNDNLPFSCLLCERSYGTKHCLQKHNYSVHNPNKRAKKPALPKSQHKCLECNQLFRSAVVLRAHKWKHTGIICDICGRTFAQSGYLKLHKLRHTGIKDFKCKECDREFFTAKELKSHMICHTGKMSAICEICGKACRNGGALTAHMRRHTGERPYKCNVCDKSFFSNQDLKDHAISHTSEKPYSCDICGATFPRKKSLRVHKRIHANDRRHECKICGKRFSQSTSLNTHMRIHDVEKKTARTTSSNGSHEKS